jgi:hypothetical protein
MTFVLDDGTQCTFTSNDFPSNAPWPPDWNNLPAKCRNVIEFGPNVQPPDPLTGGCYIVSKQAHVTKIRVKLTLEIYCGCIAYCGGTFPCVFPNPHTIRIDTILYRSP